MKEKLKPQIVWEVGYIYIFTLVEYSLFLYRLIWFYENKKKTQAGEHWKVFFRVIEKSLLLKNVKMYLHHPCNAFLFLILSFTCLFVRTTSKLRNCFWGTLMTSTKIYYPSVLLVGFLCFLKAVLKFEALWLVASAVFFLVSVLTAYVLAACLLCLNFSLYS